MDKAIALLPLELRPLFEKNRAMVVERAIDPDTWRTAGFAEEPPNHFLDIDWEGYGKYPVHGAAASVTTRPWRSSARIASCRKVRCRGGPKRCTATCGAPSSRSGAATRSRRWTSCFCQRRWRTTFRMRTCRCTGSATTTASCRDRMASTTGGEARCSSAIARVSRSRPSPLRRSPLRASFVFDRVLEDAQLVPALLKGDADAIGNRDVLRRRLLRGVFQRAATRHGGSAR